MTEVAVREKMSNPQARAKENFLLAQQAREAISQQVFAMTPVEIGQLGKEAAVQKAQEVSLAFRPALRESANTLFQEYVQKEHAINSYLGIASDAENTAESIQNEVVKGKFFDTLFTARKFSAEDIARFTPEIAAIRINRNIHGALAFDNMSVELFQRLTVAQVVQHDGIVQDTDALAAAIKDKKSAGFVDSLTELLPQEAIPAELQGVNVDIAFIYGESPEVTKSLEIYEENKVVEKMKKELVTRSIPEKIVKRFEEGRIETNEKVDHALVNQANRLVAGHGLDYLAAHGITPEYLLENPDQIEGAKLLRLVAKEVEHQMTDVFLDFSLSEEQFQEKIQTTRQQLAADMQNAVSMEQLLILWTGKDESIIRQEIANSQLSLEDYYAPGLGGEGFLPPADLPEGYYAIPEQTLPDGSTVNFLPKGPYTRVRQIAAGGFGIVYEAYDPSGRKLVIKEPLRIAGDATATAERKQKLLEEYNYLKRATDAEVPHIAKVYDIGTNPTGDPDWYYMVQDFAQGKGLDALEDPITGGPKIWRQDEAIKYMIQVFDTLWGLHNLPIPIIHKDIKDENLIRTPTGDAIVLDFGISRDATRDKTSLIGGSAWGSAGYAPKEQYAKNTVPASDIYAAGRVFFQLLTGEDPRITPFTFPPVPNGVIIDPDVLSFIKNDLCADPVDYRDPNTVIPRPTAEQARAQLYKFLGIDPPPPLPVLKNPLAPPLRSANPTTILPPPPAVVGLAARPQFAASLKAAGNEIYTNASTIDTSSRLGKALDSLKNQVMQPSADPALVADSLKGLEDITKISWRDSDIKRAADLQASKDAQEIITYAVNNRLGFGFNRGWFESWANILQEAYGTSRYSQDFQQEIGNYTATLVEVTKKRGVLDKDPVIVTKALTQMRSFGNEAWVQDEEAQDNTSHVVDGVNEIISSSLANPDVLLNDPDQGVPWAENAAELFATMALKGGQSAADIPLVTTYRALIMQAASINPTEKARMIVHLNAVKASIAGGSWQDPDMALEMDAEIDDILMQL